MTYADGRYYGRPSDLTDYSMKIAVGFILLVISFYFFMLFIFPKLTDLDGVLILVIFIAYIIVSIIIIVQLLRE